MERKLQYVIIAAVIIAVVGIAIGLVLIGNKTVSSTPVPAVSPSSPAGVPAPVQTAGNSLSGVATTSGTGLFTIRTPTSSTLGVIDLANELGYYRDAGIVIEYTGTSTGGPQNIMTVASGSNDVGGSAFSAIVNAVAKGTKIKVIAPAIGTSVSSPDYKWLVLNSSPIKKASDLKGKTIAVNTLGAQADFVTRAYLYQNNLSPSDVQLVVLPYENMEQALKSGQIDVIAPNGNFWKKAETDGGVRALFTDAEITGDQVKTGTFMSTDFIEKHPDIARKFVNATVKAIEWDKQNRNQSRVLLGKFLKENNGNPQLATYFTGWSIRTPPVIWDSDVQFWIDIMVKEGTLKPGQLKPSDVYTNEFNPYAQG
jgi:ABC-type nitrate/sulfonate/bicarbonate transport system substrate-binding protein